MLKDNNSVPYQIKVSRRARKMRLAVACDSTVTLTLPSGMAIRAAEKFVAAKLSWIKRALEYFKTHPVKPKAKAVRGEYKKFKHQALSLAQAKVKQWAEFYGVNYQRISIKNQKTRWGSCSRKGNLNFNYRIVHLRSELLDYLVVHEVCHLKEFNHSRKFWAEVAKAAPNYKQLRAELRAYGF
ncbi:MAG: M48 family metallopeptidase [Candidatus Doudnabacteria bacterium]|nr:M48 family metallopeptidase [Candidatus Doudnabacteria bacterium]